MIGHVLKAAWDNPVISGVGFGVLFCAAIIAPLMMAANSASDALNQAAEDARVEWAGAELVRICADGSRIRRLNGRLVTGVMGAWSKPQPFAADVTPEGACAR